MANYDLTSLDLAFEMGLAGKWVGVQEQIPNDYQETNGLPSQLKADSLAEFLHSKRIRREKLCFLHTLLGQQLKDDEQQQTSVALARIPSLVSGEILDSYLLQKLPALKIFCLSSPVQICSFLMDHQHATQ